MNVFISEEATEQLQSLEDYLAERFYPNNAERFIQRLVEACYKIGTAPYRGTKRDDLSAGIRSTGFERRVTIYFKIDEDRVNILGIYYGGHSPQGIL